MSTIELAGARRRGDDIAFFIENFFDGIYFNHDLFLL